MWTWLASLVGGPVVNGLINAYKAKLAATNTQDRIAADLAAKEIEAEIEARRQASAIIIAEQGRWYTAIIRPLLAAPVIIYFWKVLVIDKVLGLGSTDPITGMVADWSGMIITAYVGGRSIEKVARIFARRS
ncbi:MAG: hypothetical protein FJX62_02020 [Alphaproteobacteria bacterium]|nr:hypothetical protein [Alphaproteobacteria bacterium]